MARRTTYIYKVKARKLGDLPQTFYAYARNQKAAIEGLKQMGDGLMKHWSFEAVCFAEADFEKHPDLFKLLNDEEVEAVRVNNLAAADAYSRRREKPALTEPVGEEKAE